MEESKYERYYNLKNIVFKNMLPYIIRIVLIACLIYLDLFEAFDDIMDILGYIGLSEIAGKFKKDALIVKKRNFEKL